MSSRAAVRGAPAQDRGEAGAEVCGGREGVGGGALQNRSSSLLRKWTVPRLKTKGQSRCWEASRIEEEAKQQEENALIFVQEAHCASCLGQIRVLQFPCKRLLSLAQDGPLPLGLLHCGVRLVMQPCGLLEGRGARTSGYEVEGHRAKCSAMLFCLLVGQDPDPVMTRLSPQSEAAL